MSSIAPEHTNATYKFDPIIVSLFQTNDDAQNEHACYVRHRISEKGKLLQHQINTMQCYAWNLCEIYDVTCCSENPKKHLPFSCKFNDNKTLASYANGIYDYYDVEQIEEFVAFMGAYEIESMCKQFEDSVFDA